jgi:hypothetical protein
MFFNKTSLKTSNKRLVYNAILVKPEIKNPLLIQWIKIEINWLITKSSIFFINNR